jgi:FkbM family methyltransferase
VSLLRGRQRLFKRLGAKPHHPVFEHFPPLAQATFDVGYLGVRTRQYFHDSSPVGRALAPAGNEPPVVNNEYLEWIDVLESVTQASGQFVMIEGGAGWGRWLVRAARALEHVSGLPYHLIAVEAEPTHFAWLRIHLRDNGIDLNFCDLHHAALAARGGEALFLTGKPDEWYGQRIIEAEELREVADEDTDTVVVPTLTLGSLIRDLDHVDLVDLDIQGAEAEVLANASVELDTKVRRVHVATHSEDVETELRALFRTLGWVVVNDYGCGSTSTTPWGEISFVDGVQTWLNPASN